MCSTHGFLTSTYGACRDCDSAGEERAVDQKVLGI
nr:MAG TPA: hypothetical protein [Caudoviricetes sp.]